MVDWAKLKFPIICFILEILFIIIFAIGGRYDAYGDPKAHINPDKAEQNPTKTFYPYFQDVHVMIFAGFGFLMTFLRRYGYSAIGYNLLIAAMTIQWASLVNGIWHMIMAPADHFTLSIAGLLNYDFATATVLISFGAVLGKTGPVQLLIMALIETLFSQVNKWLNVAKFGVEDAGESMFIHAFGAYFGLAVARVLYNPRADESKNEGSTYQSDLFSMIGTIFLWIFWPSFNGGLSTGSDQERAVLNTYYSLAACTVVSVALSIMTDPKGKLNMVHVQNATLAGGVAMGTAARMPVGIWGACLLGAVSGILSMVGFIYVSPVLKSKLKIQDTCGVHNLHGMPGVLAAVAGALTAAFASWDSWGVSIYSVFPAMLPEDGHYNATHHPLHRSPGSQCGYQFVGLIVTLIFAIVTGVITGFVMKLPIWDGPNDRYLFDDTEKWNIAEEGFPAALEEDTVPVTDKEGANSTAAEGDAKL